MTMAILDSQFQVLRVLTAFHFMAKVMVTSMAMSMATNMVMKKKVMMSMREKEFSLILNLINLISKAHKPLTALILLTQLISFSEILSTHSQNNMLKKSMKKKSIMMKMSMRKRVMMSMKVTPKDLQPLPMILQKQVSFSIFPMT